MTCIIVGIGVDIERVERFMTSDWSDRLVARLFTAEEIAYCQSKAAPARHLCARFAAKEATVKALCEVVPKLLTTQVEVYKNRGSTAPKVRLIKGAVLPPKINLFVSLSHTDDFATAFVVAEREAELPVEFNIVAL